MNVSVIVSTYNSPTALEQVLWGYAVQTYDDFDVIVADDGSAPETLLVIERLRSKTRLNIERVWQPDLGFRKCRILNRAIAAARGEYLIFSDGDCIPQADFVATHTCYARPQQALSGGCIRLPRQLSAVITPADVVSGRCMQPRWLWLQGGRSVRGLFKLAASELRIGGLVDRLTPTRANFNGHNSSVWRADAVRVNGFDERMAYGGLDREFGERLVNAGIRFRQIRHQAVCLHLDHPRCYATLESRQRNDTIRSQTRHRRLAWTPFGIDQNQDQRFSLLDHAA